MPFVAHGADYAPKQFCSIAIKGKWKIHHYDGIWKRMETALPEDATECSPCADYDPISKKWRVSYIAGGFEGGRKFKLYFISDLENPKPEAIADADVGFVFKNRIVLGGRSGGLFVSERKRNRVLKFTDAEYLYRVSYNPNNPNELLISGQKFDSQIFSRSYDLVSKKLCELSADGQPAYKLALFNNESYFAYRGESEGFEDRKIVKAHSLTRIELSSDLILEFDI